MKAINSILFAACFFISTAITAQSNAYISIEAKDSLQAINQSVQDTRAQHRINFYVVNRPKTLDLFSRLVIIRARKKAMSRGDKFIVIVVRSSEELKAKMLDHLQKKNAMVGSLWFDTHGHYANGYSSFILGKDEFSYKTVNDSAKTKHLRALAPYCDEYTKVGIGSCYGGATYEKPEHNGKLATRMNGDSLMIGNGQYIGGCNHLRYRGLGDDKTRNFCQTQLRAGRIPFTKKIQR